MTRLSISIIISILISGAYIPIMGQNEAPSGSNLINLRVKNIKSDKGTLMVAIYKNAETFLGEQVLMGITEKVTQTGIMELKITGLSKGYYAISIFHDENDNGELDTKIFRLPKEPYGFSNNIKAKFGPPSFEKAKFEVSGVNQTIEINMR